MVGVSRFINPQEYLLNEVVTINESSGYQAPVLMAMEARDTGRRGPPVEAGRQQVRVDVDVTYRLVDPA